MPKLFISYRRDDSDFPAHAIYEALQKTFGKESVFIDVDTIPPGVDFREYLGKWVGRCDILLAIIGSQWLSGRLPTGERRLDDPRDFVRIEIEAALRRAIPVIPVLVGRVTMPSEDDLPSALKEFAYRHAVEVRSGHDFEHDVGRMVGGIEKLLASTADADTLRLERQAAAPEVTTSQHSGLVLTTRTPPLEPPRAAGIEASDEIVDTIPTKIERQGDDSLSSAEKVGSKEALRQYKELKAAEQAAPIASSAAAPVVQTVAPAPAAKRPGGMTKGEKKLRRDLTIISAMGASFVVATTLIWSGWLLAGIAGLISGAVAGLITWKAKSR